MLNKCFSLRFSRFISLHFTLVLSTFLFCSLQPRFIFNSAFNWNNFLIILLSHLRLWRVRCITLVFYRFLLLNLSLLIISFQLVSSFRGICSKGISSKLIIYFKIITEWRLIILYQRTYRSIYQVFLVLNHLLNHINLSTDLFLKIVP